MGFPIHTDRNVLVARQGHVMNIKTLEDAKEYTVGTQRNDYTEGLLRSMNFPRIDISADFNNTLSKLAAGRIDLMPMSESALKNLPRKTLRRSSPSAGRGLVWPATKVCRTA